jgi:hypothetical protein
MRSSVEDSVWIELKLFHCGAARFGSLLEGGVEQTPYASAAVAWCYKFSNRVN